jgi:16S rRNA (uracil1498-N3)-methyltransferase
MQLFYEPEILINGGILNAEESHHCIRVLRHKQGDKIEVINGLGKLFTCVIIDANSKKCKVSIESETEQSKSPITCHIAIAPTKNIDRIEWFLEKSTEIGIEVITPILCKNSERKVIKHDRLQKVITSAVKQSLDLWHPQLLPLIDFKSFINQPFNGVKLIAHCHQGNEIMLKDYDIKGKDVLILIGPEGDFDKSEVEMALANGFSPISLGAKRLRTETAAMVACHIVRLINS